MFADSLVTEEAALDSLEGLDFRVSAHGPFFSSECLAQRLANQTATTSHCSCLSSLPIQHSLLEFRDIFFYDHNFAHLNR